MILKMKFTNIFMNVIFFIFTTFNELFEIVQICLIWLVFIRIPPFLVLVDELVFGYWDCSLGDHCFCLWKLVLTKTKSILIDSNRTLRVIFIIWNDWLNVVFSHFSYKTLRLIDFGLKIIFRFLLSFVLILFHSKNTVFGIDRLSFSNLSEFVFIRRDSNLGWTLNEILLNWIFIFEHILGYIWVWVLYVVFSLPVWRLLRRWTFVEQFLHNVVLNLSNVVFISAALRVGSIWHIGGHLVFVIWSAPAWLFLRFLFFHLLLEHFSYVVNRSLLLTNILRFISSLLRWQTIFSYFFLSSWHIYYNFEN